MKKNLCHLGAVGLLIMVAIQMSACGATTPARFYTLTSPALLGDGNGLATAAPHKVVGIGPVALAKYLDHPAITTRTGANMLARSELDRWGGSLADEVNRVLVENMRHLLPGESYLVLPWLEAAATDFRLQVDITRFEAVPEGTVILKASWLLFGRDRSILLASGDAFLSEAVHGSGYAAITEAMSRSLYSLSRRISEEIGAAGEKAAD